VSRRERILILAVTLAASAAAVTLFETLAAPVPSHGGDYASGQYFTPSPVFSYHAAPGSWSSVERASDGTLVYQVTYDIGADGFRTTPGNPPVAPATVYFFGGSIAFGECLAGEDTIPAAVLAAEPGVRVENFGFHGWGVHQALVQLERLRPGGRAVHVLLTNPGHALRAACKKTYARGTPRYALEGDGLRRAGVCPTPGRLVRAVEHLATWRAVRAALADENALSAEDWTLYLALLEEFIRVAQPAPVIIGVLPAHDAAQAAPLFALARAGVQVVDLRLYSYKDPPTAAEVLHPEDLHPSALSARRMAARLAVAIDAAPGFSWAVTNYSSCTVLDRTVVCTTQRRPHRMAAQGEAQGRAE